MLFHLIEKKLHLYFYCTDFHCSILLQILSHQRTNAGFPFFMYMSNCQNNKYNIPTVHVTYFILLESIVNQRDKLDG